MLEGMGKLVEGTFRDPHDQTNSLHHNTELKWFSQLKTGQPRKKLTQAQGYKQTPSAAINTHFITHHSRFIGQLTQLGNCVGTQASPPSRRIRTPTQN